MTDDYIDNPIQPSAEIARRALDFGVRYPYDAPDEYGEDREQPIPATNWQIAAARAIIANLTDRRGIKHGFDGIDEDVRSEIVMTIATIIDVAPGWYAEQGTWSVE